MKMMNPVINGEKKCSVCNEIKNISEFYFYKKLNKYIAECKACRRKRENLAHKLYPEKYYTIHRIEIRKKWRRCTPEGMYSTYKTVAKQSNIPFRLGLGYFIQIINKSCYYCGTKSDGFWIGIDRKNNEEGYVLGNVVPCCYECNKSKIHKTEKEFLNHCKRVVEYQKQKEVINDNA